MKVLITGGTGFIGSHIVMELLAAGDEITIFARNPSKIPEFTDMPGLTLLQGELDNVTELQQAIHSQDACIHNAIIWDEQPTELQLKDTLASLRVFEAAANAGVGQLIYTSSTAVHRPFTPLMDESQRITTNDFYGAMKAAAEAFLFAFSHQSAMRCNVVRPGPTIGRPLFEGSSCGRNNRIEAMVLAAHRGEDIHVVSGEGRQFIGVTDLAKVYSALLRSSVNRETYIAVAKNFTPWQDIAERVVKAVGTGRVAVSDASKSEAPCLFDVTKLERELGCAFDSDASMIAAIDHMASQLVPAK